MQITKATFATAIEASEGELQTKPIAEKTLPKCPCSPKGLAFMFEGARKMARTEPFAVSLDVSDPKGEARHYDITVTPKADGKFEHCQLLQMTFKRLGTYKGEVTLDGETASALMEVSLRES